MTPLSEKVKVTKRVRRAIGDSISRQQMANPGGAPTRLRIGSNGNRRIIDIERGPETPPSAGEDSDNVLGPIPRRTQVHVAPTDSPGLIPGHAKEHVKVSVFEVAGRLWVWLRSIGAFAFGTAWDVVRRRDSEDRRAIRLRQILLPVRICDELSLMLDSVPPFPTDQAIEVIERTTGQKLETIFSAFDPVPIGSASIACVYQAVLRDSGDKVAVKVRRPGIWKVFEADFRVLDSLTKFGELLTFTRPGYAENFRTEFRSVLSSELDFRREARYQELFLRRARKKGKAYFTAPKVCAALSNDEVLVMEFVSGMWLSEVLAGVERGDEAALARMKELNIDPKVLSRRLLYANNWGLFEHLAFHADPHPANIVVRANSELVFIDFGACGYVNRIRREMYARVYSYYKTKDTWGMAQLGVLASEPLPPMDINAVVRDTEAAFHELLLTIQSKHSFWYERTSASMWISMLRIVSKYNIPTPIDVLMYARSTLLYDTLAARLYPQLNYFKEYEAYGRDAAKKAGKRVRKAIRRRLLNGPSGSDFETLEKVTSAGNVLLFRLQRLFAAPYDFTIGMYGVEKWIFMLMTILQFAVRGAILTALGIALILGVQALTGQAISVSIAARQVITVWWYWCAVALLALVHLRRIRFRLGDKIPQE